MIHGLKGYSDRSQSWRGFISHHLQVDRRERNTEESQELVLLLLNHCVDLAMCTKANKGLFFVFLAKRRTQLGLFHYKKVYFTFIRLYLVLFDRSFSPPSLTDLDVIVLCLCSRSHQHI